MPRAVRLLNAGAPRDRRVDTLILNAEQRRMQRGFVFGAKGTCVELDFADPVVLRTDDVLLLDDGSSVEIVAEAEPLLEVRADFPVLARLAWMLGDRHVAVEILPTRIRLRRDPALEALLTRAGGKVVAVEAPFEPEGGAYAASADSAGPHHDHGHEHHDHAHDNGHRHAPKNA
jgi:urease accessory protein